jgi:hypothetical protein
MREACSNGQNSSDQSDNRKNIEDRLAPRGPLHDLQPQLDYFATDIGKFGLGLGPQVSGLGPHASDLGPDLGAQAGQLRFGRQFRQSGGE